jgi:hypothetical protein
MRRTLTTLIAALGLLLTGLLGSPAADATSHAVAADATQARGQKPVRDLHDEIVKKHGKLYFQGRVDPGHGPVVVQKKACAKATCRWHTFKQVRTHGPRHRWQVRVYAPRHGNWYWRGYVRAYGGYARSWTHVWKTYVTRL